MHWEKQTKTCHLKGIFFLNHSPLPAHWRSWRRRNARKKCQALFRGSRQSKHRWRLWVGYQGGLRRLEVQCLDKVFCLFVVFAFQVVFPSFSGFWLFLPILVSFGFLIGVGVGNRNLPANVSDGRYGKKHLVKVWCLSWATFFTVKQGFLKLGSLQKPWWK